MRETTLTNLEPIPSKVKTALWYKLNKPDLGFHVGTLERCDNDLVKQAEQVIEGGPASFWRAYNDRPDLQPLLTAVLEHPPRQAYVEILERPRPLVNDLWPDKKPVMVVPVDDGPLMGRWPAKPGHTCQEAWRAEQTNNGFLIDHFTGRAWRGQICDACYYDRTFRLAKQIETEARLHGLEGFKWEIIPAGLFTAVTANFRQRRQRTGAAVRYLALPQFDTYFVIHNDPGRGGEQIPTDRAELYALIANHADTNDERRLSSCNGWGGRWSGTKGDSRPADEKPERQPGKEKLVIMGRGILELIWRLEQYPFTVKEHGGRYTVQATAAQFLELLEIAGIKHHIISGHEFVAVTDKGQIEPKDNLSPIRDKPPKIPIQRPLIPIDGPPEPAPLYL